MKLNSTEQSPAGNSTYPKVAVHWLNQALYFLQSLCLVDSEVLRNSPLHQALKCCKQFYDNTTERR